MPPFHILRTRKKTPILAEVWVNCMYATVILINRALCSTNQSYNLNTANKYVRICLVLCQLCQCQCQGITGLQGPGTAARPVNQKVGCYEEKLVTYLNHKKGAIFGLDQRFCRLMPRCKWFCI